MTTTLLPLPQAWAAGSTPTLSVPRYDRSRVRAGIAHIGVGNFHRVHLGVYQDDLLSLNEANAEWGILGIGLVPPDAERAAAYQAQDCLYSVTTAAGGASSTRLVGSMVEYLYGPADPAGLIRRLTDPAIRILSLTITEGGYNLDEATGEFRSDAPEVAADLARPCPLTAFGVITAALAARRAAGVAPFTVMSCDNLRANGETARRAVVGYAREVDPELAAWIETEVAFPSSMVDRIAPRVDAATAARIDAASGLADAVPALTEPFRQWVIEDSFPAGRPPWEEVGVELRSDVGAFEALKGRILNATHSMLAYPGLLLGLRTVHEAAQDEDIAMLLEEFMARDAGPLIAPPPGVSVADYAAGVVARFANPDMRDTLERIASDGAGKLPVFHRATAEGLLAQGRDPRRLALLVATFRAYVAGRDDADEPFEVLEPHLGAGDAALLASPDPLDALGAAPFAAWGLAEDPAFVEHYLALAETLRTRGARAALAYAVA